MVIPEIRSGSLAYVSQRYRRSPKRVNRVWEGAWFTIVERLPGLPFNDGFPDTLYPVAMLLVESRLTKDPWERDALELAAERQMAHYSF